MSIYPHRHDAAARIFRDEHDRLWVTHAELLANDYKFLEDFDIVYLNGNFYELQAYMDEPDAWWIEEVETDNVSPQDAQEA